MIDLMNADDKVVAVTAAMPDGTGLAKVAEALPGRVIDTGICESHAMDMCAGMAKAGVKPFFAVYSTFAQRAVDQVFQEVALQKLPVRICMDRGGYVGGDGAVHHGFMDIAMLRTLPNVVQIAPCDEPKRSRLPSSSCTNTTQAASFIRYPRDNVPAEPVQRDTPAFELGKANLVYASKAETPAAVVLAYGVMVNTALASLPELEQQGYDIAIYDARFAMPIDIDLIRSLIERTTSRS